jgi:hypothetical protein
MSLKKLAVLQAPVPWPLVLGARWVQEKLDWLSPECLPWLVWLAVWPVPEP